MDMEMANEVAETVMGRLDRGESLHTSLMVTLLNFGDELRGVHCISGDWSGTKAEVNVASSGLPICPQDGRPLLEDAHGWRLGLIEEDA